MNAKQAANKMVNAKINEIKAKAATAPAPATGTKTEATKPVVAPVQATAPAATVKPATPPATNSTPRLGKSGIAVLTAISKEPLTRSEISFRTGIKSGFCSLLGHVDPLKTEPSSLSFKGYLTVGYVEGKSASAYSITDKGREALKAATTPTIPTTPAVTTPATPKADDKIVPVGLGMAVKASTTPTKAAVKKPAAK